MTNCLFKKDTETAGHNFTHSKFNSWKVESGCVYLSGARVYVLGSALIPVSQQLNGGARCTKPQEDRRILVKETVIVKQVLVQHRSGADTENEDGHNVNIYRYKKL